MKRKRVILIAAGCTPVLGALLLFWLASPEAVKVDVAFSGYTNGHYVAFTLNNRSSSPVEYVVGLPQIRTNDAWSSPLITADRGIGPALSLLGAGKIVRFVVVAPADLAEWRVPVFWRAQGKRSSVRGVIHLNLRLLKIWWQYRNSGFRPRFSLQGETELSISYSAPIAK